MQKNFSPWIYQLNKEREAAVLAGDLHTDIAIVGAGIAGVATAFFLLEETDAQVVLLEGGRLAHGATGHNAGQVTSYMERSLVSIAEEFGIEMTAEGQRAIEESGWDLITHIYTKAELDIPFSRFTGHAGVVDFEMVLRLLRDNKFRKEAGLKTEEFLIARNAPFINSIPLEFGDLYSVVPQGAILSELETDDQSFYASVSGQNGCVNSALFCQEVVSYLLKKYKGRFALYEHTHIEKVILKAGGTTLDAVTHTIEAEKVILCTNGFENITIINNAGLDVDTRFHHNVEGIVGFMSGYLKDFSKPPMALRYLMQNGSKLDGEYFYLTRREFEYERNKNLNLISIGGPEMPLSDRSIYSKEIDYPEEAQQSIDKFVREIFEGEPKREIDYIFKWHGLMGYTRNKIRLIGEEPKNSCLLYNLGCNGVGILPSIYGGKKIAQIVKGERLAPSIFDPQV